jgi:hypothetical protein
MRRKINPWARQKSTNDTEKQSTDFQPKRMQLPQFQKRIKENPIEMEKEEEEEEEAEQESEEDREAEDVLKTLRRTKKGHNKGSKKRRGYNLSVCVSEEEEAILRAAAATEEMGFSEWARMAMFKFAKIKPPKR